MRLAYYAGASTAAAAACLVKAFHERPNFYSATVYLSQSNACLLILTNLLLLYACATIYTLQRLLYGPLRPIEIEQLSEKAWYAVLDTLLAMPSFREDVGGWLLTMFVLLLAGKVWGWIGEGRVDILEQQQPANPRLFHTRLASSLVFSVIFDVCMTRYCLETVAADPRPGMMVIFTFEFAILTVFSTFTLCRYILSLVSTLVTKQQMVKAIEERKTELRAERAAAVRDQPEGETRDQESSPQSEEPIEVDENEVDVPGWEEKRRWLFALEMTADFLKLLLYIVFFTVSITFSGLPMHIMRDVYMTFASFTKRLGDYVNYKKATSDMNARYPDATTAEIRDDACIVCREDMIAWENPAAAEVEAGGARPRRDEGLRAKKLPCGHILHLRCLKAWLERQQVCPTCRRPVIAAIAPPAVNAGQGHAAGAPGAPAAAANNAAPPRQAAPNRARFFNLGPLRVGFLNAPAGQMDNIVNQLRGVQPQAPQAAAAPAAPAVPATVPQDQHATNHAQHENDARLTQLELTQMSQRIMHETNMLSVEHAQLNVIRAMAHEFNRLSSLHRHNTALGRTFQPSTTNTNVLPQTLAGHPSQSIPAGADALPQGMTLPEGWTLMPLHRQNQQLPTNRIIHQVVSPFGELAHPTPATNAPPAIVPPQMPAELSSSIMSPPHGTSIPSNDVPAPTPDAAQTPATIQHTSASTSEQTVPIASQVSSDSRTTAADIADTSATNKDAVRRTPWTSQNWDFKTAPEQAKPEHHEQSSSESSNSKGKGRAVEVEDVPDSRD